MTRDLSRPSQTYKIYVGNLHPNTSNYDLSRLFSSYGVVIEAVALTNKGFGFVHMASEEEGARAMKGLYKHMLHGKEMLLQPALNPKKASVSSYNSKRATIGGKVSNIDDFEEISLECIDKEIANYLASEDTPPSPEHHVNQAPGYYSTSSALGGLTVLSGDSSAAAASLGASATNTASGLPPLLSGPKNTVNPASSSSIWSVDSNLNSLGSLSSFNSSSGVGPLIPPPHSSFDLLRIEANRNNDRNDFLPLARTPDSSQLMSLFNNESSLGTSNFNTSESLANNSLESSILKLNEAKQKEQEYQKYLMLQQQQQLLGTKVQNPNNGFGSAVLPSVGLTSGFLGVNGGLTAPISDNSFASIKPSASKVTLNTGLSLVTSSGFSSLASLNSFTSSFQSSPATNTSSVTSGIGSNGSSVSSSPLCNNNPVQPTSSVVCGVCNETYNSGPRAPKILGCTHTFCLSCLHALCISESSCTSSDVRCPAGCGVTTHLTEAGVSGLTTNQAILSAALQANSAKPKAMDSATNNDGSGSQSEVCVQCSGTTHEQPLGKCREEGHALVPTVEAEQLIVSRMKPLIEHTLHTLGDAVKMRGNLKGRVESTHQALTKFTEELRVKLTRDEMEQELLRSTANDLNSVYQTLSTKSYVELVRTYHMVQKCSNDISTQFNQCLTACYIHDAVQSIKLRFKPHPLQALSVIGVRQDEEFPIEKTLVEHARSGNYANVLLQYMVTDLLSSRLNQTSLINKELLNSLNLNMPCGIESSSLATDSGIGSSSSSVPGGVLSDTRSVCSSSPNMGDNQSVMLTNTGESGVALASLPTSAVPTPDITAANVGTNSNLASLTNNLDSLDINCIIKSTTDAIESENLRSTDLSNYQDMSLGLSNICSRAADATVVDAVDLEKSLLEGSAYVQDSGDVSITTEIAQHELCDAELHLTLTGKSVDSSVDAGPLDSNIDSDNCDESTAIKPFSYLDAAKKPAKPLPETPRQEVVKIAPVVKAPKPPHCWMKLTVDDQPIGRIVFLLRPDKAPKMCENFLGLCLGRPGYGYKGTHFFKNGDGFLAGGDVENDDGTGGFSIYNKKKFEADLCPLKDEVGMIRFKGNGTSDSGRGMVGSQFMVWYAEREFKKFSYSLVFGRVVDGMDVVKKAANVNLQKHDVKVADCGGLM